jgi:ribonuclease BN (tRNA processing enzyme)
LAHGPAAGQACSGYLVEYDGFRLLIYAGYATVPRLLQWVGAGEVDAVFISHEHPDHCADLNPLLRARALSDEPPSPLAVYALAGALDAVLALGRPSMLADACVLHELTAGQQVSVSPFGLQSRLLPDWVPNLGVRLAAGGQVIAYTGDCGPSPDVVELAYNAGLSLAKATYAYQVPADSRRYLSSAREAGQQAARAGAGQLMLTHPWPGTDPAVARATAAERYDGAVSVAVADLLLDLP